MVWCQRCPFNILESHHLKNICWTVPSSGKMKWSRKRGDDPQHSVQTNLAVGAGYLPDSESCCILKQWEMDTYQTTKEQTMKNLRRVREIAKVYNIKNNVLTNEPKMENVLESFDTQKLKCSTSQSHGV